MSSTTRNVRPSKHHAERVIAGFERDGNQWRLSAEIGAYLPETISNTARYNVIHTMSSCTPVLLTKEPYMNGVYRYRLAPDYKSAMLSLFPGLPAIKALVSQIPTDTVAPTTRHIRWDDGEQHLMIEQVRELRRKYMGLTVLDAARKAQEILIEQGLLSRDRRRPLSAQNTIQFVIDALFNDDGTPKPDPADEPVTADNRPEPSDGEIYSAVSAASAPEELQKGLDEAVAMLDLATEFREKEKSPKPLSLGQAIDTLLPAFMSSIGDALATRIQKAVADGIAEGLARRPVSGIASLDRMFDTLPRERLKAEMTPEKLAASATTDAVTVKPPKHNPEPPASEKDKRPRVLILGLRPDEVQLIKSEFTEVFDLRFWHSDQHTSLLKDLARTATVAFALVNRLHHKGHENLVTAAGVPYTRVSGNVNQMQEKLTAYFAEQPS